MQPEQDLGASVSWFSKSLLLQKGDFPRPGTRMFVMLNRKYGGGQAQEEKIRRKDEAKATKLTYIIYRQAMGRRLERKVSSQD